ncbi:MAG: DedA family protein [Chloroflexi bacterium]|nr:DedA family protein [Chloroflexota bacterium]
MSELHHTLWQFVQTNGYPAIFLLLLIEESGVPLLFLPGDLVIMWAGYQYFIGNMDLLAVLLLTTAAVALGSSALYTVSYRLGHRMLLRFGKVLHVTPERVDQAAQWVHRYGFLAVVAGRLIPGLRTPTSVASGVLRLPYHTFLPATITAAALWTLFYFFLGVALGAAYDQVDEYLMAYLMTQEALVVGLVMALAAVMAAVALRRFRRTRSPSLE